MTDQSLNDRGFERHVDLNMPRMYKEKSEENTLIACDNTHSRTLSTDIENITTDGNSWLFFPVQETCTPVQRSFVEEKKVNLPSLQDLENSGLVQLSGALGSAMLHLHTRVTARKITSCAEKHQ